MIIKKFQAKNEAEALALAKKELGSEVTMIHSRNVKPKGFFSFLKKMQVEITVAKEEEMDRPEVQAKSAIAEVNRARKKAEEKAGRPQNRIDLVADDDVMSEQLLSELKDSREKEVRPGKAEDHTEKNEKLMEEKLDNIQNLLEQKLSKQADEDRLRERRDQEEAGKQDAERKEMLDFCRLLHRTLLDNEVTETNANELVDEIRQNYASGMTMEHMLSFVYQKIILKFGKPVRIAPSEKCAKVVFFIGPTGVGKTTTLAKVASRFRLMENKQVALFTTDTYRISATDQLKTYANILGVPFHVIYEAKELVEQYERYKDYDYILVDTAGHSHKNEEQKKDMMSFLEALPEEVPTERHLVLSATTKYKDLLAIADAYKEMTDYRLIFTKLDETRECGNLLNLRLYTGEPISYVTNGQNVPDDIEVFNPQSVARSLLTDQG